MRKHGNVWCRKVDPRWLSNIAWSRILAALLCACALLLVVSCSGPQQTAHSAPLPPLQYLGEWGVRGTSPGQFQNPRSLSTDSVGNVYIADDGSPTRIEKFDSLGHPLLVVNVSGSQNDWDIAVDPGNAIFLVDVLRAQIHIFSPEGEVFRTLSFRYRSLLSDPASIAIQPDGEFYLADFESGRIAKMYPRGRILQAWRKPKGLPVARWTPSCIRLGAGGNLYVADPGNDRIEKLSNDVRYISSWDFPFSALKSNRDLPKAYGLAVSRNFVVASDERKRLLEVWTLDGQPQLTVDFWHHPEWGQNAAPTDVTFMPTGELLVLDRPDARVLRFRLNIPEAPSNPAGR